MGMKLCVRWGIAGACKHKSGPECACSGRAALGDWGLIHMNAGP